MSSFRLMLFPVLGLMLLLPGCVPGSPRAAMPSLLTGAHPSARADVTFAYLKLEQAMRNDDMTALLDAARTLLVSEPASRPLADAAGWLLGNRHTEQAHELLEAAVKALPEDLPLHIMLAETLLEEGRAEEAIRLLKQYSASHPDDGGAKVELALLYLRAENYPEALAIFERLPSSERTPSVRYYQAQALRAAGRTDAAAETLRSALAEAPDFLEAMLELALVEEQRGRHGAARKLYEKLLTYDEGNQDILLRLVVIALKEGNPHRAYEIASSVPDSLSFVLTAASLFMDEGRFDLAGTLLDMMAQAPDTPEEIVFYQAAVAYEGEHNPDRTLELISGIGPSNRFHDKALKLRIQVLYEKGDAEQALAVAQEGRALYPADLEIRYAEMELLMRLGRRDEALRAAEEARKEWPKNTDLAFHYAFLVDQGGDKARAMALMEELIQTDPDNAQALNYVGYTLADENRDLERALQLLTRAVELSPEADFILDSLAWAQYRLGRFQEAWQTIRHALSLSPGNAQDAAMWEHYGDIARAAGLPDEARRGWLKALEMNPSDPAPLRLKLEEL